MQKQLTTKSIRILLSGGGSGGHIYPLLAVAESLKNFSIENNQAIEMRYIGSPKQYDLAIKSAGIQIRRVAESKLRRYFSLTIFLDIIKLLISTPQALWHVFWFMPDVAFSKGGPGALPVLYACRFYRIPIIIHESDAIPSLTTRLTAKFASRVLLAFESTAAYLPENSPTTVIGNPVRAELILGSDENGSAAKRTLDFSPDLPLILVLGGSQGADIINQFILNYLPFLVSKYQILHQTGLLNYPEHHRACLAVLENLPENEKSRYRDVPFLERDLRTALMAADIVISRAGSGAIFEIAAAGKPSILIPLESSANGHQNENAFQYHAFGACAVLKEENMGNEAVVQHLIISLMSDKNELKKMSENARMFAKPQAAEKAAALIIEIANIK